MFPTMRQRLIMTAALVVGALVWVLAAGALKAPDDSAGLSLLTARAGWVGASVLALLAGLPALGLGVVASVSGNPLSGVFTASGALLVLACAGGSMEGWLRRRGAGAPPAGYVGLMLETVIWFAGLALLLAVIQRLRSPLRSRWPALAFTDHLGVDTHLRFPQTQALLAGLVCLLVGGTLSFMLLRNAATGQVVGGLLVAFMIGGLAGQLVFPQSNPVAMLFSPAVAAILGYAWVALNYRTPEQVLAEWYRGRLPGLALALPVFYASAAVAGCAIGIGWAQGILEGSKDAADVLRLAAGPAIAESAIDLARMHREKRERGEKPKE